LLSGITFDLVGNGTLAFSNDTTTASTSEIDALSVIDATGTATTLSLAGTFTSLGTIEVTGTQASLAIPITADGAIPGSLINQGQIIVDQGDTLTISGGTVFDPGTILVDGGIATITGTLAGPGNFGVGGSDTVVVNGGTLSDTIGYFGVGNANGSGTLLVEGGGTLITGGTTAFADINATGSGHVAAAAVSGSTWISNGQIIVGDTGSGFLDINNFGRVNAGTNSVDIGNQTAGSGTLSLESGGTLLADDLSIDNDTSLCASGTLTVTDGTVQVVVLTENANGVVNVGSDGSVSVNSAVIGASGTGAALTMTGGEFAAVGMIIADDMFSTGTVTVYGGTLTSTEELNIGGEGNGLLTVNSGGSLVAGGARDQLLREFSLLGQRLAVGQRRPRDRRGAGSRQLRHRGRDCGGGWHARRDCDRHLRHRRIPGRHRFRYRQRRRVLHVGRAAGHRQRRQRLDAGGERRHDDHHLCR